MNTNDKAPNRRELIKNWIRKYMDNESCINYNSFDVMVEEDGFFGYLIIDTNDNEFLHFYINSDLTLSPDKIYFINPDDLFYSIDNFIIKNLQLNISAEQQEIIETRFALI